MTHFLFAILPVLYGKAVGNNSLPSAVWPASAIKRTAPHIRGAVLFSALSSCRQYLYRLCLLAVKNADVMHDVLVDAADLRLTQAEVIVGAV